MPNLLRELGLSIADIELSSVRSCVHHELLRFKVIGFGYQVSDDVRMFRQKGLVVDLLPFEPLPELSECLRVSGCVSHSRKSKVL